MSETLAALMDPILLVEDDPGTALLEQNQLTEAGWACEIVTTGQAALDWLANHQASLVLLDNSLPDMTGQELLSMQNLTMPPFIITTGAGSERLAVSMMKQGARDYLVKDATFLQSLQPAIMRVMKELETEGKLVKANEALHVHQIELEMQNEELRRAHVELDAARERYFDLYDLAPVGYVTVSEPGLIQEANLTAARLLGAIRGMLVNRPLTQFISQEDQTIYYLHRKALFETGKPQVCELRMVKVDGTTIWAHLAATGAQDTDGAPVCRVVISDMTEHKLAEAAQIENEVRYQRITEAITDYIYTVRVVDGRAVETTHGPGCLAVTGYQAHEYANDPFLWLDMVAKEDRPEVEKQAQRILSHEDPPPIEHRIVHKNGTVRWVSNTFVPHRDEHGILVSYDGLVQDITDRKRAENALRVSEESYRLLIENSHDIIYTLNTDGLLTFVSRAWTALLGHQVDQVVGQPFQPFVHPDDVAVCMAWLRKMAESGQRQEGVEYRVLHLDGSWRWHTSNAVPIMDESGTIVGFEGTARDITERKQAEEALRKSEQTYRLLVNSIPDTSILLLDKELRYLALGGNEIERSGFDKSKIEGKSLREAYPLEVTDIFEPLFQKALQGESTAFEMPYAEYIYFQQVLPVRDSSGNIFAAMQIATNITKRKANETAILRLNEELEQRVQERTAQLETVNKELEAFSYSISHDLRGPLRGIDGFSKALLEDYKDKIDEGGKHYLTRICTGTQRMGQIIEDLLKLSHITRGELNLVDNDLSRMCRKILDEKTHANPERRVEIAIQPGISVQADHGLLRVALENLLGNAWKFTSKNDLARIEVGETTTPDEARIFFIRDNGAGFDMAFIDKLFNAFQRLHTTSEFEGTGIGLTIVQRIIHRHGGRIWAESEKGTGTTFFFTLSDRGE